MVWPGATLTVPELISPPCFANTQECDVVSSYFGCILLGFFCFIHSFDVSR